MSVAMSPDPIRVLVVDDHRVVREGTRRILEAAGFEIVGEAGTGEEALEAVAESRPDVVLADVRLPGMTGIELTAALREAHPATKVLVLSAYANPAYARAALKAGAVGYLVKTASDDELAVAVRSASLGTTVLDSRVSSELMSEAGGAPQIVTEREREVIGLVVAGLANKAVAMRLQVSPRTVDAHLAHLFTKLAISSRAELVAWAARHGMLEE